MTFVVASLIAFEGYKGLANVHTVFSYIVNIEISQNLTVIGTYPLLMLQAIIQRSCRRNELVEFKASGGKAEHNKQRRKHGGYTLVFIAANWILMIYMNKQNGIDPLEFQKHLDNVSQVSASRAKQDDAPRGACEEKLQIGVREVSSPLDEDRPLVPKAFNGDDGYVSTTTSHV
ncbi:hypothetical protein QQS21_007941 [Conoideocrella luteorostrata]|uniref:Uncharacterized protein n=1 Tax=Conoideocrella luteorostrata TaxID=1105319 RepID=A0AAJ0CK44_9HYPO|nr:hypothetical protein QQS21_007941 [Conoideocrella luteorostrata]